LNYTVDQRKAMAKAGMALPDGSYPIKTRQDLKNAIHLVRQGNTPTSDVKAFCIKRAKALHAMDMIPPSWLDSGVMKQSDPVDAVLSHFGIKGMKWGVRRSASGARRPTSTDAKRVAAVKAKVQTHGRQSVSNKQLKDLVNRMNLEQQHANLSRQSSSFTKGHERIKNILAVAGTASAAFALASSPMGKALRSALKSGLAKAATSSAVKTGTALVVSG